MIVAASHCGCDGLFRRQGKKSKLRTKGEAGAWIWEQFCMTYGISVGLNRDASFHIYGPEALIVTNLDFGRYGLREVSKTLVSLLALFERVVRNRGMT